MQRKHWFSMITLSSATLGSRVLGLVRDAFFFSVFGNNRFSSAFLIAFTIPNLFRRLLGEGALASAFIPVFAKEQERSKADGFYLLNQTLTRMVLLFGGAIVLVAALLALVGSFWTLSEGWELALPMVGLLLPYALLVCMAAILTAALNTLGKFFFTSLSPILLNLCMIGALLLGAHFYHQDLLMIAYVLCGGVLLGGLLQLLLPVLELSMKGWTPTIQPRSGEALRLVNRLFLTATTGAAVVQINVLVSRMLAYQVSDEAVSQLYLASRLTELPMGMFAVAIYTVIFPALSKLSAIRDEAGFSSTCTRGLILTLAITLPAAVGLAFLAEPIVALLFQRGRFGADAVIAVAPVVAISAWGIPLFSLVAFLTRVFHARQEMTIPVRISAWSVAINLCLSVGLMIPFGVVGLAWATVITAGLQSIWLSLGLQRLRVGLRFDQVGSALIHVGFGSLLLAVLLAVTRYLWPWSPDTTNSVETALLVGSAIGICILAYCAFLWLAGLTRIFRREG